MKKDLQQGFTLIELLVVIGIIAVLAAIVLIAINPKRQFQQANDARRRSDVNAILNAVSQNIVDNKGTFTCAGVTITSTATNIGAGSGNIDIRSCIVPTFISEIPVDPTTGTAWTGSTYSTGYKISYDSTAQRYTISATPEVVGATISVSR